MPVQLELWRGAYTEPGQPVMTKRLAEDGREVRVPGRAQLWRGKKCKECEHLKVKQRAKNYFKCKLIGDTNGPGTDKRLNDPACDRFEPRGGALEEA